MDEKVLGVLAHVHRQVSFSPNGHMRVGSPEAYDAESGVLDGWPAIDWLIDNGYLMVVPDDMVATEKGLEALKDYNA